MKINQILKRAQSIAKDVNSTVDMLQAREGKELTSTQQARVVGRLEKAKEKIEALVSGTAE